MRYCPNCKQLVKTHMTAGQVFMTVVLWLGCFPIGILYSCFHARKCPHCGCSTNKQ